MQIKQNKNPWGDEGGFEQMKQAVKPVKKAVSDVTKTVVTDVMQQVTGNYPKPKSDETKAMELSEEEKKRILAETAKGLAELNAKIEEVRKKRLKKEQALRQAQGEQEAKKKQIEEKKKEEPIWKKMMKMGSQSERKVNAGG